MRNLRSVGWQEYPIIRELNWMWGLLDRFCFGKWYLPIKIALITFVPWIIYRPVMYLFFDEARPWYVFIWGVYRLWPMPGGPLRVDLWMGSMILSTLIFLYGVFSMPAAGLRGGKVKPTVWFSFWLGLFWALATASSTWHYNI